VRAALPGVCCALGLATALWAAPDAAGVRIGSLPWTEAEALLTRERVVVLPLGAGSKEHGPHLPLENDRVMADYLAGRLLAVRPVALLPTLTYAFYPAFLEYPGSVSLASDTQRDLVAQVCRSLARQGPRRFYVLNTGISTVAPLEQTAALLKNEGILMRFTDLRVAGKAVEDRVKQELAGTHADEVETSMMLYIDPSLVRMDKAVKDGGEGRKGPLTRDPKNALGQYSASGVFGDATLATRAKGQAIVEAVLADILADVDALARQTLPAGTPRSPLDPP
jgi:creatinine amidohydrolase